MKKLYSKRICTFVLLNALLAFNSVAVWAYEFKVLSDTTKKAKTSIKISDTRINKPDFLKTGVRVKFTPFKPLIIKPATTASESKKEETADEKALSNVKVYPNPVQDEINLSYKVNKDSNVTIKIMDVLGNEISTLLSQKLPAGEQVNTFNIASRLNSGFYFIRLMVGNEIVVKRISVL